MPCYPHGEDAIEHIHAERDALSQLLNFSHAHQISRRIFGEKRGGIFHHALHFLRAFPHSKPADGVSIESDCYELLGAFLAQITVETALDDAEEQRMRGRRWKRG